MDIAFYNEQGMPIAYTEDETHIFLFSGEPVAYIYGDSIFSYLGKHLGWYIQGWIRDNNGDCVFFSEKATGRPIKPVKSVKQVKPVKNVKEVRPVRPVRSLYWSSLSTEEFFNQ